MDIITVGLDERSYPIYIGQGLLTDGSLLKKHIGGTSAMVVSNEVVAPLYLSAVEPALHGLRHDAIILPDGEQFKNIETLNTIYTGLLGARFDRGTTLVALGGGVVGDMTGYAAASYLRGVNFIQIPTTLLAQVDSSVGGKTGINHPLGKNMIGAFYQPECVLIDTDTLDTLDDRQLSAGIAEIIKYGLIRDAEFFEWLEANMDKLLARDPQALVFAIRRSCENKAAVVAADEYERSGQRALLNLGHTFGHAIETGLGYGEWLHGEAVACGMVMAAQLSERMDWLQHADVARLSELIKRARLPVVPPASISGERFHELMSIDKKVMDGQLRLILLKAIGKAVMTAEYDPAALHAILDTRTAA